MIRVPWIVLVAWLISAWGVGWATRDYQHHHGLLLEDSRETSRALRALADQEEGKQ